MPLVLGQKPISVTIQLEDRDKNRSGVTLYYPSDTELTELVAIVAGAEAAIGLISNANIVGASINLPLVQNTINVTAPEESDVERKGVFSFATTNPASYAKIEIPSVDNALVVDGTNVLDASSAAVAAVIALFRFGVPGFAAPATNGVGFDITDFRSAYKRHRRSGKG